MKIAQVCPYDFSRPGGVKSHIVSLSKRLTSLGHEVKILVPKINATQINETNVYLFGRNRSINFGGTKIDINIALGKELRDLKQFLKEEKFDIIHFHTIWNPLLPLQIRWFSKAKHVATFHDTPKNQFIGKTLMPLAAKLIFNFLDQVISVSNTQATYINKFSSKPISIIPNGIDVEFYQKETGRIESYLDGKFNLLFLGRLEPRKGVIYALESFRQLKPRHSNLRLIIAGDGDERLLVETYIKKHKLLDVEFLGVVSEEVKLQLLKTVDIYIASAIYGESFGIVLLEAMASGTAMAGFANEGYKNILTEEMIKYFPEPKNVNKLNQAIASLIDNDYERSNLVIHGLEKLKEYDWKLIAQKILKVYQHAQIKESGKLFP